MVPVTEYPTELGQDGPGWPASKGVREKLAAAFRSLLPLSRLIVALLHDWLAQTPVSEITPIRQPGG